MRISIKKTRSIGNCVSQQPAKCALLPVRRMVQNRGTGGNPARNPPGRPQGGRLFSPYDFRGVQKWRLTSYDDLWRYHALEGRFHEISSGTHSTTRGAQP